MRAVLTLITCLAAICSVWAGDEPVAHWSFQKPVRPDVPEKAALENGDRIRNPIDAFVFARLGKESLTPAPAADRNTLVRRAYFDLIGLPPTPEKVAKFVNDTSENAWSDLIDELLESRHYGERWGRHWLDVARYADSRGFEGDASCPNAWRYRDYVIQSFNADKPYDQFVQEQIAGDEIWPDNLDGDPKKVFALSEEKRRHLDARIGTGLYTFGPEILESAMDGRRQKYERLTDWVDTTGSAFLGLTVGCARCHDHKFDPISQRDYFAMQAIFVSSKQIDEIVLNPMMYGIWLWYYAKMTVADEAVNAVRAFDRQVGDRELTDEEKARRQELLLKVGELVVNLPGRPGFKSDEPFDPFMGVPTATVLGHERPELVKPVHRLERGELYGVRERVTPALPEVLAEATGGDAAMPETFGCRKALALWLTRPDHPLTARVMVNRIWGWHFGHGIVATPNDFGTRGKPPSHPDLLDWLATEFVARGWSIKKMHRLILQSSTYQMASRFGTEANLERDPDNKYLWRMNRRRLEAEVLWDSVHAVAGTLNTKMFGRPVVPALAPDEIAALREPWQWPVSGDLEEHRRRGIYILVRRNFRFPMFDVFDTPVVSVSCPERSVTTVAPQALWALNNRSVYRRAEEFAGRVVKDGGKSLDEWIEHAWLLAVARSPTVEEKKEAALLFDAFVTTSENSEPVKSESLAALTPEQASALVKLCLGIFNLSEFMFID
jgi:hypothetical protein